MKIEVLENDPAVAERAASIIAEAARNAAATRRGFTFAVSGGRTPWAMLSLFAANKSRGRPSISFRLTSA